MAHWVKILPPGSSVVTEWDKLLIAEGTLWDQALTGTVWDLQLVEQDNWEKQLVEH